MHQSDVFKVTLKLICYNYCIEKEGLLKKLSKTFTGYISECGNYEFYRDLDSHNRVVGWIVYHNRKPIYFTPNLRLAKQSVENLEGGK